VPRSEVSLGAATHYGPWQVSASERQNVRNGSLVSAGFQGSWQNECMIIAMLFNRRFTSLDGDNGATTFLIQITFKTVGQFGFSAL
jgi:LPS-assembly protein